MSIAVRYGGVPRPIRTIWGEVGFEELSNGALVAGQPNGSPSWFPCDDHPSSKASYRIQISTDSPYYAVAPGQLVSRRVRAGQTVWTYEMPDPTSTYLATVAIGPYELQELPKTPVPMKAASSRSRSPCTARSPEVMRLPVTEVPQRAAASLPSSVDTTRPVLRSDLLAASAVIMRGAPSFLSSSI
jgi:hypothetical protein